MRKLIKFFVVALLGIVASSCQEESSTELESSLVVNYRNIRGVWEMTSLEGEEIEGDAYFYISFTLSDDDEQRFEAYTSFDSAYSSMSEGVYTIEADEDDSSLMVISGIYDNMFLEPWNSEYIITTLKEDSMEWTDCSSGEVRGFERAEEIPEDIVAGTRAE